VALPDQRPAGKNDTNTLRWCVRSDGNSGFVFVNNYERLRPLPPKSDVQFEVKLPAGALTFPDKPITVPSGSRFFWPFNFNLGKGVKLAWATAQPLCPIDDDNVRTVFFAETKGVSTQFALDQPPSNKSPTDQKTVLTVKGKAGGGGAWEFPGVDGGTVRIVLLNEAESLSLWKGQWQGRERVFMTKAGLVLDGDNLRLTSSDRNELNVGIYPAPKTISVAGKNVAGKSFGIFQRFTPSKPKAVSLKATFESVQPAGPAREIPLGKIKQPVAAAPEDPDFEKAAVWRIQLPAKVDLTADPLLRINYVGDVARVLLNGKLVTDDFYNGNQFEVGLRRHAPEILGGDLRVAILPLRKDAPIYLAKEAKPDFGKAASIVALRGLEIVPRYQVELHAAP